MNKKLKTNILHYISQPIPKDSNIVQHSIPVVFFGDIEKAKFATQNPDGCMDRKSGCLYNEEKERYVLLINFNVPLVNATSVNAKAAFRAVKDIMEHLFQNLHL